MSKPASVPLVPILWSKIALIRALTATFLILPVAGCSSSPEFNILGSYFPSWIMCLAIASTLTFAAHIVIAKRKMADQLWPLPLVYTSLVCFFSCTVWIIFYE